MGQKEALEKLMDESFSESIRELQNLGKHFSMIHFESGYALAKGYIGENTESCLNHLEMLESEEELAGISSHAKQVIAAVKAAAVINGPEDIGPWWDWRE